jgi:hypothetical protein
MADLLTRAQILEADDIPVEDVEVPEWGGVVRVRGLSGAERDAYEGEVMQQRGRSIQFNTENARAKLVARCVIDENGQRLFRSADVKALGRKSGAALNRVFTVCRRLSGLGDEDIQELVKNSGSDQSDDSTSD